MLQFQCQKLCVNMIVRYLSILIIIHTIKDLSELLFSQCHHHLIWSVIWFWYQLSLFVKLFVHLHFLGFLFLLIKLMFAVKLWADLAWLITTSWNWFSVNDWLKELLASNRVDVLFIFYFCFNFFAYTMINVCLMLKTFINALFVVSKTAFVKILHSWFVFREVLWIDTQVKIVSQYRVVLNCWNINT